MFHVKRGAASLVHEDDEATLSHVTEGVSRETDQPAGHLTDGRPPDETDVSRETD